MEQQKSTSILSPLRYPSFRLIWTATLFANLGSLVQGVGAAWAMAELTPSPTMIALVQASTTLPIMALAMIAGAVADNFNRRRVMLFAQSFMAIVSGLLAAVAFGGYLTPWVLLSFTFALGLGAAMHLPSWQASMRDLVPRADLPSAVTLNSVSFNLMRSVGPALGGVIVASSGPSAAFALNAISYLAVIFALIRWKAPIEPRSLPAEKLGNAVWAGIKYVALSPNLVRVMARGCFFGIAAVSIMALLPVITRDRFSGDATSFGLTLGLFGFGAIFGATLSSRIRRIARLEAIVAGSFLLAAVGTVILALAESLLAAAPGLMLTGAAWVLALSHFNVSTQLATPRWVVGRALAMYQTLTFGGMALGAWFWGFVSEHSSIQNALFAAAAMMVLGALLGFVLPMPDLSDANLEPLDQFKPPSPKLDLRARSGPIMIMVDWEIDPKHTNEFLRLMVERRRIRRRDGASNWALLRDLENPDIWVESYHLPTWTDYLRHNQRRTQSDSDNIERLRELHRGPNAPHVHRMIERHAVPRFDDMPLLPPTTMEPH